MKDQHFSGIDVPLMNTLPQEGDLLDVDIDRLAYGGDGVARVSGFALFVPRTAPSDRLRVRVEKVRRRYGRAIPLEIIHPSSDRQTPLCPYFDRCGGCHYQHLLPDVEKTTKESHIRDAFERLGPGTTHLEPMIRPESAWNYRNRVTYHCRPPSSAGYISWLDSEVIDIDRCAIAHPILNDLWSAIRKHLARPEAKDLRFVFLRRTSIGQRSILLSFATEPSEAMIQTFAALMPEVEHLSVTTVKEGSHTPFGETTRLVRGTPLLIEKIGDIEYHVPPSIFFQVNPEMTERLVELARAWAKSTDVKRVIDLYCGAGLFTLALAKEGFQALGVESNFDSIRSAQVSAEKASLSDQASFRAGKADRIATRLYREGDRFDAAIVDPPRKGLVPEVIESFAKLGVKQILYVSCSPPTMARDAVLLQQHGFSLLRTQPLDLFPQTYHVELVGIFSR